MDMLSDDESSVAGYCEQCSARSSINGRAQPLFTAKQVIDDWKVASAFEDTPVFVCPEAFAFMSMHLSWTDSLVCTRRHATLADKHHHVGQTQAGIIRALQPPTDNVWDNTDRHDDRAPHVVNLDMLTFIQEAALIALYTHATTNPNGDIDTSVVIALHSDWGEALQA